MRVWQHVGVTVDAITSGIDLSYLDTAARPQDDLFGHVTLVRSERSAIAALVTDLLEAGELA